MPASQREIASLKAQLNEIIDTDHSSTLVRPELGEANFAGAIPLLEVIVSLFRDIRSIDLSILPPEMVQNLEQRASNIHQWLEQVEGFDLNRSNPPDQSREMIDSLSGSLGI